MKIVDKGSFYVKGLKIECKEEELFVKMPKLYQEFYLRIDDIKNKVNHRIIDICLERKKDVYTQLLCLEVENLDSIPEGMEGIQIEQGTYLYYIHKGLPEEIYDAFVKMYDFALKEKLRLDSSEFKIEIHDETLNQYELFIRLENE